jgi:demethylmenaquinone methyltransferase/2-methoxy-6-polyprenyl-1,4-benzoquinol methylase
MTAVLPQGDEKARMVRAMFDAIAPRYDLVNRIMTFRMDVGWRRRAVRELRLPAGSLVLDLAAGTGDLCRELATAGHRPVGVDLSFGMLAVARTDAPLLQADALRLPFPDAVAAGATCGFALRNFVDLGAFLLELARVVRPGGRISLLEVAEPGNPLLRWGHGVYFGSVVPRIGALFSDAAAYRYLPRSVAYLPPPAELVATIAGAGFADVVRYPLNGGISQLLVATRD